MIDNKEFDTIHLNYIEIDWQLKEHHLECLDVHFAEMFKIPPSELYINWAAAMQIQFHVCDIEQTHTGSVEDWAYAYLKFYVGDVYRRADYMVKEYAKPFEPYIK